MEYLDVVNAKDRVIGKRSIDEIYVKKLSHRIVHVLIINRQGDMALQLRHKEKSFCPHHWSTAVGGHVQAGETYEQAALREMHEELGITIPITLLAKDTYLGAERLPKYLATFQAIHDGQFPRYSRQDIERVEFFPLRTLATMIKAGEKFHPELLFLLDKHFQIA